MFANFATKRHLNGPLRAVSPVTADDDINWKQASAVRPNKNNKTKSSLVSQDREGNEHLASYFARTFKGRAKPVRHSIFYSLKDSIQLFWVEAISLLIPSCYIALVLTLFFSIVLFVASPMVDAIVSGEYLMATAWSSPVVLSLGLFFVLIKPLFGGFISHHGRVLKSHEAPDLMQLVFHLSKYLGVKPPKRIEINNETVMRVDAYAGINSLYRDDYKIIIGAPLLYGMDMKELTAMLTHELAHFRYKHKKISYYLINHVSEWLYSRAMGRDKRHQKLLVRMQKESLSSLEYGELWCWRKVHRLQQSCFHFLFRLHRKLTAWKCREIELMTDANAMNVVGSQAFESMLQQLRLIQSAQAVVSEQNKWAWKEGFLLDDYALAVAMEAKKLTRKKLSKVQSEYQQSITYFCPSDADRLKQSKRMRRVGLMTLAEPALDLLNNGSELSKELTVLDYASSGINAPDRYCISSAAIRKLQQRKTKVDLLSDHYFDRRAHERILKFEPSEELQISSLDVQASIDFLQRIRVEDQKQQRVLQNLKKRIEKSFVVERLKASKLPVKSYLKQEIPSDKQAKAYLKYMRAQYEQAQHQVESVDQVFYQRAHGALGYMDIKLRNTINSSFHNLELYCQVRKQVASLKEAYLSLGFIVSGLHNGVSVRILRAGVEEKRLCWTRLQDLHRALKSRPIQVSLHKNSIHVLAYLEFKLGDLPGDSGNMTVEEVSDYIQNTLALLDFQYQKWLSQVAVVMTRFEKHLKVDFSS